MKKRVLNFVLAIIWVLSLIASMFVSISAQSRYELNYDTNIITGEDIVAEARKWKNVGATYWSGTTPWQASIYWRTGYTYNNQTSFDCSGFVGRVLNDCGIRSTNYTPSYGSCILKSQYGTGYIAISIEDLVNYGTDITDAVLLAKKGDYSKLQPGDIIGWTSGALGRHIIIYAGLNDGTPWMVEFTGSGYQDRAVTSSYQKAFQYGARVTKYSSSYLKECTPYICAAKIKITQAVSPYTLPCNSTTAAKFNTTSTQLTNKALATGDEIVATGLYKNSEGNFWYKVTLKDGTSAYVYSKYTEPLGMIEPSVTGGSFPSNINGSTPLKGTVTAGGATIDMIRAVVYKGNTTSGTPVIQSNEYSVTATSYQLYNSDVDLSLPFQNLAQFGAGTYTLVIEAKTSTFLADGKVLSGMCSDGYRIAAYYTFTYGSHTHSYGNWESANTDQHVRKCSCGDTIYESHTWDAGAVGYYPTCTQEGSTIFTCTACNTTTTASVEPTGHSYSTGYLSLDSIPDSHIRICDNCGYLEQYAHEWTLYESSQVTCISDGFNKYVCTPCSKEKLEEFKAIGHSYNNNGICSNCNSNNPDCVNGHEYGAWELNTIDNNAPHIRFCLKCNAFDYNGHLYSMPVDIGDAVYHRIYCSYGDQIDEEHIFTFVEGYPATCESDGLFSHYICSPCGKICQDLSDPNVGFDPRIPKAHSAVWIPQKAPTCAEPGHIEYLLCTVCNMIMTPDGVEASVEDITIPKTTEHSWGGWWVVGDIKTYLCINCDATKTEENFPEIYFNNVSGSLGGNVSIQVFIKNNPGVAFLSLSLEYDQSVLTLASEAINGEIIGDLDHGTNLMWTSPYNSNANGILCTLTFNISPNAVAGDYPIYLVFREAYDENDKKVDFVVSNGSVQVFEHVYGDVNGDRLVDGRDVIKLRQYMANYNYDTGVSTVAVSAGADVNGDGTIDGRDVIKLRQYMANYNYDTGSSTVVLGPTQ